MLRENRFQEILPNQDFEETWEQRKIRAEAYLARETKGNYDENIPLLDGIPQYVRYWMNETKKYTDKGNNRMTTEVDLTAAFFLCELNALCQESNSAFIEKDYTVSMIQKTLAADQENFVKDCLKKSLEHVEKSDMPSKDEVTQKLQTLSSSLQR